MDDLVNRVLFFISNLNNSKYFAGITMILLNLGSKYISMDLSQTHETILGSKLFRRIIMFVVVFTATRDILISIIITAAFIILVSVLSHDDSNYCLIPKNYQNSNTRKISKEEMDHAKKIIEEGERQMANKQNNVELFTQRRKEKINNYKQNILNLYSKTSGLVKTQKNNLRARHRQMLQLIKQNI
jgi:hypothetical protein